VPIDSGKIAHYAKTTEKGLLLHLSAVNEPFCYRFAGYIPRMRKSLPFTLAGALLVATFAVSSTVLGSLHPASALTTPCADADSSHFTVSNTADSGVGSLRNALADAQTANGGTVCVTPGLGLIYLVSHIEYTGTGSLSIIGNDATVQGGNYEAAGGGLFVFAGVQDFDPPFAIHALPLQITGFTLKNGLAHDGGAFELRAVDGVVTNMAFDNNAAQGRAVGGAIASWRSSAGSLFVSDSSFTNNVDDCNDCGSDGGGAIDVQRIPLTVVNSSFVGNSSTGPGGAIDATRGELIVLNSTFVDNVSAGGNYNHGGAVFSTTQAQISYSTFSGNTATTGSAVAALSNSNFFANVLIAPEATAPLCEFTSNSSSYNFANETANSCGFIGTGDSSLDANDAGLGVLSTGPGVQQWRAPGPSIIGLIPNGACLDPGSTAASTAAFDEVNAPRPNTVGGPCTPGAVEPVIEPPATTTTTTTSSGTPAIPAFTG